MNEHEMSGETLCQLTAPFCHNYISLKTLNTKLPYLMRIFLPFPPQNL
jgi:hypothetical protein